MDILLISALALVASGLTLFSGFGLGTILPPAFALILPVEIAIAATAIVHLANNLFKAALLARHADRAVLLRFAVPAVPAALAGAALLVGLSHLQPVLRYDLWGQTRQVEALSLAIGVLTVGFALLELSPGFARLAIAPRFLPLGGVVSGFFGGLSGNQGAFRSAFLLRAGLSKQAFVATGVLAAVMVDVARLGVYGLSQLGGHFASVPASVWPLVLAATVSAFLGAFLGARLLAKVTLRAVQLIVAAMMVGLGTALAAGLI